MPTCTQQNVLRSVPFCGTKAYNTELIAVRSRSVLGSGLGVVRLRQLNSQIPACRLSEQGLWTQVSTGGRDRQHPELLACL